MHVCVTYKVCALKLLKPLSCTKWYMDTHREVTDGDCYKLNLALPNLPNRSTVLGYSSKEAVHLNPGGMKHVTYGSPLNIYGYS